MAVIAIVLAAAAAAASTASPGVDRGDPADAIRTLTVNEMFRLAEAAHSRGDHALAEAIYRAMFSDASPDVRLEARFRLAKLESARGNLTTAAVLLREIIDQRPQAMPVRLELAQVLAKMGDNEGAWRQVRAIHAGGLPPSVARLIDRYSEALRARRPLGASFEIALAPDSNINRATRSETLSTIFGNFQIADAGKGKSGTGLALNAQGYRRLPLGGTASLLVRTTGFANLYKRGDFNDIAADLAVGPELYFGRNRIQVELAATQRWYGQKPFMRSARIAETVSHPAGSLTMLRLSGSAALLDNQLNHLESGKSHTGQFWLERALTPTTGLAASVSLDRESLKDPGYSTTSWRAGLSAWRDLGRVTLTGGFEFGRLAADRRLLLFPSKRGDHYSRFSIGASVRQLQFHGFAPIMRFSIERNRSTVEFYDYRRTRTEIGVARAF